MTTFTNIYISDARQFLQNKIDAFSNRIESIEKNLNEKKASFFWPIENLIFDIERVENYSLAWLKGDRNDFRLMVAALEYQFEIARRMSLTEPSLITAESMTFGSVKFPLKDFYTFVRNKKVKHYAL